MPGVIYITDRLQNIVHALDDAPLHQQLLVLHVHQHVLHVFPHSGDQLQPLIHQLRGHLAIDKALISKQKPFDPFEQSPHQRGAVVRNIARLHERVHQLARSIDHDKELETIEPAHCRFTPSGRVFEYFMRRDPLAAAHGEGGRVGIIDAHQPADAAAVQVADKGGEHAGFEFYKAIVGRSFWKVAAKGACQHLIAVEVFKALVAGAVVENFQAHHFREADGWFVR